MTLRDLLSPPAPCCAREDSIRAGAFLRGALLSAAVWAAIILPRAGWWA